MNLAMSVKARPTTWLSDVVVGIVDAVMMEQTVKAAERKEIRMMQGEGSSRMESNRNR